MESKIVSQIFITPLTLEWENDINFDGSNLKEQYLRTSRNKAQGTSLTKSEAGVEHAFQTIISSKKTSPIYLPLQNGVD